MIANPTSVPGRIVHHEEFIVHPSTTVPGSIATIFPEWPSKHTCIQVEEGRHYLIAVIVSNSQKGNSSSRLTHHGVDNIRVLVMERRVDISMETKPLLLLYLRSFPVG
jgi:hypothetical protein